MLSPQEQSEIQQAITSSYDARAACIDAMRIVQAHRRWVSDEAMQDLSELLSMSVAELEGVATFYSLIFRHPVGEHVLKVCDGAPCWILGSQTLLDHLQARLSITPGQTTPDDRFTLLPICCLGDCDHAPVMLYDDVLVQNLTPQAIDGLLEQGPRPVE